MSWITRYLTHPPTLAEFLPGQDPPRERRRVQIMSKLARHDPLTHYEQDELLQLLWQSGRGRAAPLRRRNLAVTLDAELTDDSEKVVATRWGARARIGSTLMANRPLARRILKYASDAERIALKRYIDLWRETLRSGL